MAGPNSAKTPLHSWHRAHGAKMVEFGGWDMPLQFADGILQEHLATRKFCGLFDVCHMGRFRIEGEEALPFLQWTLSNDSAALTPGQAQYTLLANERGGVIDDAYLYCLERNVYLLVVNAANRQKDERHLREQARPFKSVAIEDVTSSLGMIALQGPLAQRLLEPQVENGALPDPVRNRLNRIGIGDAWAWVARTGYTGEPIGFELFAPASRIEDIWQALHEDGYPHGLRPVGLGARDTLRLEAGLPLYGHELGQDPAGNELPAMALPLASVAVCLAEHKGPFIGRAALEVQSREVRKLKEGGTPHPDALPCRFRRIALLDRGVIRRGHQVYREGRKIGTVTSGSPAPYWIFENPATSPAIGSRIDRRVIAWACMEPLTPLDAAVEIDVRGRRMKARTVRNHGRPHQDWFVPRPVGTVDTPLR